LVLLHTTPNLQLASVRSSLALSQMLSKSTAQPRQPPEVDFQALIVYATETGAGAGRAGGVDPSATASATVANSAAAVVGGSTTATNTNTLASTATPSKTAAKLRFVVPVRGVMAAVLGVAM